MSKLSTALRKGARNGQFSSHGSGGIEIIISDSNIPGEGEHKIVDVIREMADADGADGSEVCCIYGLDADLIVLGMVLKRDNLLILREPKDSDIEKEIYGDCEFLYLSIDVIRGAFLEHLRGTLTSREVDEQRVFNDYVLLTFLGGNDFVRSINFLQIKEGGLRILLRVYMGLIEERDDYLVIFESDGETPTINLEMFKLLIDRITRMESKQLRYKQQRIDRVRSGSAGSDERRLTREATMTDYQIDISRFEHLPYYHPDNPMFDRYSPIMTAFDYSQPIRTWRERYYLHFVGVSAQENRAKYNRERYHISLNYLKSLIFTLRYYLKGVPSWEWHYQYRVAPLMSDFNYTLQRSFTKIDFKFRKGVPYKPMEQLMLILPQDAGYLLPSEYASLMNNEQLAHFYPEEFELDVLAGMKHIYSEPILPQVDSKLVKRLMKSYDVSLTASERKRNTVNSKPVVYHMK